MSENAKTRRGIESVSIAHAHIKERRGRKKVPLGMRGTLNDYAPSYFAPRSPMLYAIHKGNVQGYNNGQTPILHLVSSAELVANSNLPFAFTDGHAEMSISAFFDDLRSLNQVDWQVIKARYWNDTAQDNDRCRRRLAEFLVYDSLPWTLVMEIGVINARMADEVGKVLQGSKHRPEVNVHRDWYY